MKRTKYIFSLLMALLLVMCTLPISILTASAAEYGDTFEVSDLKYEVTADRDFVGVPVVMVIPNNYTKSSYTIPETVDYDGVTYTVIQIDAGAFANCTNLESITLPSQLIAISSDAFNGCTNLSSINLPDNLQTIGGAAFKNCSSLTSIEIPNRVSSIGAEAFSGSGLREVTFEEGGSKSCGIYSRAFSNCNSLNSIVIPGRVTEIGDSVFAYCTNLSSILIMYNQKKTFSEYAFYNTSDSKISATITYQYATPSNLRWDGTTLRWDGVNSSYVRYKIDISWEMDSGLNPIQPKAFYVADSFCDLSEYLGQKGTYKVEVTAVLPEILDITTPKYQDSVTASIETKYPFQVEISNIQATRVDRNTGKVSFTTSMAGTMYYFLSDLRYIQAPTIDTSGEGIAVGKGNYEFSLPVNGDSHPGLPQYLYVTFKTADGVISDVECIGIPGMDKDYYTVNATASEGGSISPAKEYVEEGDSIILTVTPNEGYVLASLTVNGVDVTENVVNGEYVLLDIPSPDTATVVATFLPPHTHCICGGSTAVGNHTSHTNEDFIYWYKNNSLPTASGNYVLATDVTLSGDVWRFSGVDVTICLNGHTIARDAENKGLIDVVADTTLNICDCAGGGAIKGNKNGETYNSKSGLYVEGTGVINLFGGNVADGGNSGVVTRDGGTFNMYGGEISGNVRSDYGGGVRLEGGTFNMYGGVIKNNTAGERGGGVYVSDSATFNMRGGTIIENTAGTSSNSYGGGVFVFYGGEMTVSGASVITGNNAQSTESNLHLQYYQDTQAVVNVGELTEGADIGISMYEYGVFSTGGSDNFEYFTSDNPDYVLSLDGENLKLLAKSDCDHSTNTTALSCANTVNCSACGGTLHKIAHRYTELKSNGTQHWYECSVCGDEESGSRENHKGGIATCTNQAKCALCLTSYGDLDTTNHNYSSTWTQTTDEHYYSCSRCTEKKGKAAHDYTNNCDTDCNTCGYVRTITHNFTDLQKSETEHWYICSVCDAEKPQSRVEHSGGSATCYKPAICSICDYHYGEIDADNHDFSKTLIISDDFHYYACSRCDVKKDLEYHVYDYVYISEDDSHVQRCTCGKEINKSSCDGGVRTCVELSICDTCGHTYGELAPYNHAEPESVYLPDSEGKHIQKYTCCNTVIASEECKGGTATCAVKAVCKDCGASYGDLAPHTSGTATCTEKATCTVCGTETDEALGHDLRGIGMNENEHWSKCSRCDVTGEKQAHTIDGGLCTVCEYQPAKDRLSTGAIVAIVIACVVVLAGGGFALYWFVFKKKKV